ncbi:MAG: CRISPR-associated endonuclease Cas2 [Candidatus Riflebacteria bacterium]|nr:CRISPR-associated endonuclease Cas2 [Candidatus Riflebacteria bacterium]
MLVLVSYDVSTETPAGRRRLRKVAGLCEDVGQRVQKSVFECSLDQTQWIEFRGKLLTTIDPAEDSLRFYFLGNNWKPRVEHVGAKPSYDPEGPLIV